MSSLSLAVCKKSLRTISWQAAVRAIAIASCLSLSPLSISTVPQIAKAQNLPNSTLTLRSDVQEANSNTGVITARGNVRINYPARQLQGTATQAQYFTKERRLVLSGNVYVLQQGNSMRAETLTYLIDEGRFIATPKTKNQVESVYIISDTETTAKPQ
jgi:lipopolysaccharide export system protein LptA